MTGAAGRRLLAEFTGTGLLLAVTLYPARPSPVRAGEPAEPAS